MRRETDIRQHDKNDCAAACVASVCAHYGLRLPLMRIREACGTGADGTTMQGIIDACLKLGLEAAGLKAKEKNPELLRKVGKPIILHLEKESGWLHFIVLYDSSENHAVIMDPEDGRRHKVPWEELISEWSGYVIAVAPTASFAKGDFRTNIVGRFKELFNLHRKELLLVLAGSIAYTAASVSFPIFLQTIIDTALPEGNLQTILLTGGVLLLLALLCWYISYLRSELLIRVSITTDYTMIMSYFRKIFSLPVAFFDNMSSGELNSRISDVYRIRSFITTRLLLMAISIITLTGVSIVLGVFFWKLTIILLAITPLFILIYYISDRLHRKVNRRIIEEETRLEKTNIEWLSSAKSVRLFNAGPLAVGHIRRRYFRYATALFSGGVLSSAIASTSDWTSRLMSIVTVTVGALFVLGANISIGELVSFFTLSGVFSGPIVMLIDSTREIAEARISAERIFDILDLEQEDSGEKLQYTPSRGDVLEAKNLCYSFPGRGKLLEDLSFRILPGKINLLAGSNGSGKSTVALLLMKVYTPNSGTISCGGIDLRNIPLETWRSFVSIVPQKPEIFNGSIMENVTMDEKCEDVKAVAAACAMAGLEDTLDKLPGGLMAHTGEHACNLSGGERQKVAIARALYRRPSVLILDEADTYLDAEGKARLMETMKMLTEKGITIILISHNEQLTTMADHTITIKNAHSQA